MAKRVLPILRHATLCEQVEEDSEGRPYCYVPVHTLQWPAGLTKNYRPPNLFVYLQLQEGLGQFNLSILLRPERVEHDLARFPPQEVPFDGVSNNLVPLEISLELVGLVIPKPGHYEMWVVANHQNLHDPAVSVGWPCPPMRFTVLESDGVASGGAV